MNTPLHLEPTALHQWNVSVQKQIEEWMFGVSYLGNHSSHLWRATELNPAVFGPGATTGNTNQRRVLILANPIEGAKYGTIGQVDDTGRANYHGVLMSAQRRFGANCPLARHPQPVGLWLAVTSALDDQVAAPRRQRFGIRLFEGHCVSVKTARDGFAASVLQCP